MSSDTLVLTPRHDPIVVDGEHRLGQVVEEHAQLALGIDEAVDRVAELAGQAAPLEPADRHGAERERRGGTEHDQRRAVRRPVVARAENRRHEHRQQ